MDPLFGDPFFEAVLLILIFTRNSFFSSLLLTFFFKLGVPCLLINIYPILFLFSKLALHYFLTISMLREISKIFTQILYVAGNSSQIVELLYYIEYFLHNTPLYLRMT